MSANILLIGDSCIDQYYYGTVDRLNPEAPVPVIKVTDVKSVPGMAANVKENLTALGADVHFITNGETITKARYIDQKSGYQLLRVDNEPSINRWSADNRYIDSMHYDSYDAIVISDYNKGFISYEQIERVIRSTSKPVFIDTKKQDLARFAGADVYVKINEVEYKNRFSISKNLIVTLGSKGAMFKQYSKEVTFPTKAVEIVDVCGCGDTFLSALTYQYIKDQNLEESIKFANLAASVTVQHRGNYAPKLEEIYGH